MWYLYIIQTINNKLYTGITTDPKRRFKEHSSNLKKRAKFFRSNPPLKIIYTEEYQNRSEASKREYEIKKMKRSDKEKLAGL